MNIELPLSLSPSLLTSGTIPKQTRTYLLEMLCLEDVMIEMDMRQSDNDLGDQDADVNSSPPKNLPHQTYPTRNDGSIDCEQAATMKNQMPTTITTVISLC